MSKRVQFSVDFDKDIEVVLKEKFPTFTDYRVRSKSLDARGAQRGKKPKYNYSIEVIFSGERFDHFEETFQSLGEFSRRPIIVGAGPAGLFCALRLLEYGVKSIIIERGERANRRMLGIAKFWRYGEFNSENNVCFGEGGAGLYSDGKLVTRVKSPYVQYVMNKLVDFGAPEDTAYLSNPHLGSNKMRAIITKLSDYLVNNGCEVSYNTRVEKILTESSCNNVSGVLLSDGREIISDNVVLATGHSARDVYRHLQSIDVDMKAKNFAVGIRIEHPREEINRFQYGKFSGREELGTARYRLSHDNKVTNRGTYSFCMCPGGYVLSAGTEADGIVINGMSNFSQNAPWSNSALVVTVKDGIDFDSSKNILAGIDFQRSIESKAYLKSKEISSGKHLPASKLFDFMDGKKGDGTDLRTSSPSGAFNTDFDDILPEFITSSLREAMVKFDEKMKGYLSKNALVMAPETRTSAPVTIVRDRESLESTSHIGLFPCGEGAGYAGGITSAAVDGVKVAMSLINKEKCMKV